MHWWEDPKVYIFSLKIQAPNVNTNQKAAVAKGVKAIGKKKVTLAFKSLFFHWDRNECFVTYRISGFQASFVMQDEEEGLDTAEGEEWMQGKTLVKPPDQLDLTEAVCKPGEDLWPDSAYIMSHYSDVGMIIYTFLFLVFKRSWMKRLPEY